MDNQTTESKRKAIRKRLFKGARILFNNMNATIDCVIKDASPTGGRLGVATSVGVPETFHLAIEGEPTRACKVVWRKATQIGVAFV